MKSAQTQGASSFNRRIFRTSASGAPCGCHKHEHELVIDATSAIARGNLSSGGVAPISFREATMCILLVLVCAAAYYGIPHMRKEHSLRRGLRELLREHE